jgi:hypothetical protein
MTAPQKVFQNPDLFRHIYSFGDPSHRLFTRNLQQELTPTPEVFEELYQNRQRENSSCILEYLFEFSTSQIESYLKSYKRCFCCPRHSTDKPIWIMRQSIYRGPSVFQNYDVVCNCHCRTFTRNFIRHLQYRELVYS